MKTFKELGLSQGLLETLKEQGFEEPTEIQEKTIPLVLAGDDVVGCSATGSGKTFAFSTSIVENLVPSGEIQALVLTPTRELAEQVAKTITIFSKKRGLKVLPIYGGVAYENQLRRISTSDIIVGTPGRILDLMGRGNLRFEHVKYLVLDEVDRMFDMGFYRDVERIMAECPKKRQTMLFSATVSADIDHLVKKYTKNAKEISVASYVDPSKLKQIYYDCPSNLKFSLLVTLLKQEKEAFVMIFCSTRRNVDLISKNLTKLGIHSLPIHGGMPQNKRIKSLEKFHGKQVQVLICTDVAARGLDIKGVSHVYNYDIPKDKKEYIHRIGRTARAGEHGKAINILTSRDYENFSNINRDGSLNIELEKLPKVERVEVDFRSSGDSRGRFGGRSSGGRFKGRDGGNRSSGGRFGNNRGRSSGGRSYGNRDNRREGGDRERSSGRGYGRSSGGDRGRSYGRNDSRPRRDNRSSGRDGGSRNRSSGNRNFGRR